MSALTLDERIEKLEDRVYHLELREVENATDADLLSDLEWGLAERGAAIEALKSEVAREKRITAEWQAKCSALLRENDKLRRLIGSCGGEEHPIDLMESGHLPCRGPE